MKKIYLLVVFCCLSIFSFAQIPVAYWSIENAAHTAAAYTVTDQVSTGAGSAITATGIPLANTNGAGNSALHSGAAAGQALYANGNMSNVVADPTTGATTYWQCKAATTGLSTITLTFDKNESGAANPRYGVLYSTNGTTWTFVASVTTLNGNTMPSTTGWSTAIVALPAACNNVATLYIRIYGYNRVGGATFAVDNITLLAATTVAGAVFTTANEADIYTMVRSGGAAGQYSRNNFTATGAATNVTINNTAATSGVSMNAANTFNVTAGATVTMGNTGLISGAGSFSLAAGCTLAIANTAGITAAVATATGAIRTTTARTFNGGANYIYNAAAFQFTGTGLPAAMLSGGSVTINNGSGVLVSQNTSFASGASLNLENGAIFNTATDLIMSSGSNVNRDNGTLTTALTTYSGINLTYENLGNNSSVTTANEFPATFNGNVVINKTGKTITLNGAKTLPVLATFGNITLTAGTLASANFNISLSGNWTNNDAAAAFTAGTGTVTMNGTAAQTLGGTSPTTFNNLILNNAAGATLGSNENVNGTLTLTAGRMTIGANNLVLGAASPAVAGALSAANMIVATGTGMVEKLMTANGSYLYPVGDATGPNYSPITLNVTATTYAAGAYTGVNVTKAKHPNNANQTNYLNRYWSIATSGLTAPSYAVTAATYVPGDVVGTEANISTGQYTGALPWVKFGATNAVTHTLSSTAVTNVTSAFTGISTAGPTITSSANTSVCAGNSTSLAAVTSTGDPTLTYSWAPAASLSSATGTPVTATPTITTTYTVTITDGNGFTSTASTTVTVVALPSAILGANNVCIFSSTTLSDLTAGGLWASSFPGIASVDPSLGVVTGNAAGITTISYTEISTGCSATAPFTVNALPAIAPIGGTTNECVGLTATLTETTGGGVWSSASTSIATIDVTGLVTGNTVGITTMSYTVTDGFGCVNSVTTPDTVNAFPVVDVITGPSSVCVNSSITLADDSLTGVWASSDITIATIVSGTGVMTGVAAGNVTITYTVTNIYGCATPVTVAETVNPLPNVAAITGPSVNPCAGTTLQLSDATAAGTWSSSNTGVATISATGLVTNVAFGTDNISYTVSSALGCLNSAVYAISVGNPMPASAVVPYDTSVTLCHGLPINFVVNTVGTGLTYQWYYNASPIIGATNGSYIASVAGQYIVQLNNGTCVMEMPFTDVINPPMPVIGYNSTGPSLFTGSFYTYQWFRNDSAITAISTGSSSAVLPVTIAGFYTVVVSDHNGCFDTSASFQFPIPDTSTTAITNISNSSNISVYPNPGTSMIHIAAPVSVNISIMSTDGRIVLKQQNATDVNVTNLASGMYMIMIYDENNRLLKNQKFTKVE